MTPKKINLRGTVGETITLSAMIVPEEKYRFNVTKAKVMKGKDIDFTWEEYKRDKGNAYILTVNNLKKEKGRYTDTIILDTDSRIQPQIRIGVYGNILEPK